LLAYLEGKRVTSEFVAGSVNTNPVVIRRILAALRKAGLVRSWPGVAGGWELVSKPSAITLRQIYQLIRPGTVFALHSKKPNPRCPVGRKVQQGLLGHYRRAQAAMENELAQSTISDVLHDVLAAGK
jgi:DNA-binding IscR family transcriptional regulator